MSAITIKSYFIENAGLTITEMVDFSKQFPGGFIENHLIDSKGQIAAAIVLQVLVRYANGEEQRVFTCKSGGKINGKDFLLTEIGQFTLRAASKFVSPFNTCRLQEMRCNCSDERVKEKVLQAFHDANDGDLVCFVGDMENECDGKITPHLNPTDSVILDPLNDEIVKAVSSPEIDHPDRFLIWNNQRNLWWKPSRHGYTGNVLMAGTFSLEQADKILEKSNIRSEEDIKKSLDEVKKFNKEELIGRGW